MKTFNLGATEYLLKKIDEREKDKVVKLFIKCEDYFVLTEGKKCVDSDEFFHELPQGKTQEEKFLFGIFDQDELIAVVDLVRDYPTKDEWIIGLLLINPKYRKKGLGKMIHDEIIDFSRRKGAEKLRIGVVEENHSALKFWLKLSYNRVKITEPIKFGEKYSRIIVMNYII